MAGGEGVKDEEPKMPEEFRSKIPLWIKPQYDKLTALEKWQCDLASVQEQQNNWLMEHAKRADKHRTFINQEISDLKMEVKPAVRLAKWVTTVKGGAITLLTLIGIPVAIEFVKDWIQGRK